MDDVMLEKQVVRKVFSDAQRTELCHHRCCDSLLRTLTKQGQLLREEYLQCVERVLLLFKRDAGVERLVKFVAYVTTASTRLRVQNDHQGRQTEGVSDLLETTVNFLLEKSAAADKAVRFRCCQIVGTIMTETVETEGEFPDGLGDRIVEAFLPRLKDKIAIVRVHAVQALKHLQYAEDEDGEEDRVTVELMRVMRSDSSPEVRHVALKAIYKTVDMLDELIRRTQDVKESVREAAFRTVGEHVPIKHLKPEQRLVLMQRGLNDSSSAVQDACRFMLCSHWLSGSGGDPVKVLDSLAISDSQTSQKTEVGERVVQEMVRLGMKSDRERGDSSLGLGLSMADSHTLRHVAEWRVELARCISASPLQSSHAASASDTGQRSNVTPAEVLFARVQAEVIKEDKDISALERENRLEAIFPDISDLCTEIEELSNNLFLVIEEAEDVESCSTDIEDQIFVLQQLLRIATLVDFSEESGRSRLVSLLKRLLADTNTHVHLVEVSMKALKAAHPSESDFVRIVAEIVNDIYDLLRGRQEDRNARIDGVLDTVDGDDGAADDNVSVRSPEQSMQSPKSMQSAVRANIPKNFVRDKARAIDRRVVLATAEDDSGCASDTAKESPSEDEFVDAVSHLGSEDELSSHETPVRHGAMAGEGGDRHCEDEGHDEEEQLCRMFRLLDLLSALLTTTKQTLEKDATLAGFEDIITEALKWSVKWSIEVDVETGTELRCVVVQCMGKLSLLGRSAAVRNGPVLAGIAAEEHEQAVVRCYAIMAVSDLAMAYGDLIVGSTGDLMNLYEGILGDRSAHRGMIAMCTEAAARLLFFGLGANPKLMAKLLVTFFEKGSVADPASVTSASQAEVKAASEVGSPERLSQMLGVYFRTLPAGGRQNREMLCQSVRHVLRLLRETEELNLTLQADHEESIVIPAHNVIKFVMELLMQEAPAAQPDRRDGDIDAKEGTGRGKGIAESAFNHVAMCIVEELYTSSGREGLSGFVLTLAKILTSLPLPEEDQASLSRLRTSVEVLEALGDDGLEPKASRLVKKYAEALRCIDIVSTEAEAGVEESVSAIDEVDAAGDEMSKVTGTGVPPKGDSGEQRQSKTIARRRMSADINPRDGREDGPRDPTSDIAPEEATDIDSSDSESSDWEQASRKVTARHRSPMQENSGTESKATLTSRSSDRIRPLSEISNRSAQTRRT